MYSPVPKKFSSSATVADSSPLSLDCSPCPWVPSNKGTRIWFVKDPLGYNQKEHVESIDEA